MKRMFAVFLTAFLLTGCVSLPSDGRQNPAQNNATTALGLKESLIANGAVRCFELPEGEYLGCIPWAGNVLLFSKEGESTRLRLLSGDSGETLAETVLNCLAYPNPNEIRITQRNLAYYDKRDNSAVMLNASLNEVMRLSMPEDIQGAPLWSAELDEIFYCTKSEIRSLSVKNLVPRLLRSQTVAWQEMIAAGIDGKILAYSAVSEHGTPYSAFLETDTGTVLGTDEYLDRVSAYGDMYYLERTIGSGKELLFGTHESPLSSLKPERKEEKAAPALAMKCVITSLEESGNTQLNLYSLETGKLCASVTLEGLTDLSSLSASENEIWFMHHNDQDGTNRLYTWNVNLSKTENEKIYTHERSMSHNPDESELKQCREMAERISEANGVKIWIGDEAVSVADSYGMEAEYQVDAIEKALQVLEKALSRYPEGFLQQTGETTETGTVQICLVQSLGDYSDVVQFWQGRNAYIALRVSGQVERGLYRGMNRIIDSYVIANSKIYDKWNALNPEGFSYSTEYAQSSDEELSAYLEGENRAFINSASMTYPREDREIIMEYAMMDGNEELFAAPYLQAKLVSMCMAIRDAYNMEESPETLPWERYLQTPIAFAE